MNACRIVRLWAALLVTAALGASLASLGAAQVVGAAGVTAALHA